MRVWADGPKLAPRVTMHTAACVRIPMRFTAVWIFSFLACAGAAQNASQEEKLVLQIPRMAQVAIKKDIFYKKAERPLTFDLYTPRTNSKKLPTVIFVNGIGDSPGGPRLMDRGQYRDWARLIAANGLAAITFTDRTEHVAEDIRELVAFVSEGRAGPAVDANNLCLWACSANVRLSFPLLMEENRKALKCGVFYYGIPRSDTVRTDVPILLVRAGFDNENLNRGFDAGAQRLQEMNAPVTVVNLAGAQHAFDIADDNEISRNAIRQTITFIQSALDPAVQRTLADSQMARDALRALRAQDFVLAEELYAQVIRKNPQEPIHLSNHATALMSLKRYSEAGVEFESVAKAGYFPRNAYYNAACAYALSGEKAKAISQLHEAIKRGYPKEQAKADPHFNAYRDDPEFKSLVGSELLRGTNQ